MFKCFGNLDCSTDRELVTTANINLQLDRELSI